jgi:hypothetical protein
MGTVRLNASLPRHAPEAVITLSIMPSHYCYVGLLLSGSAAPGWLRWDACWGVERRALCTRTYIQDRPAC